MNKQQLAYEAGWKAALVSIKDSVEPSAQMVQDLAQSYEQILNDYKGKIREVFNRDAVNIIGALQAVPRYSNMHLQESLRGAASDLINGNGSANDLLSALSDIAKDLDERQNANPGKSFLKSDWEISGPDERGYVHMDKNPYIKYRMDNRGQVVDNDGYQQYYKRGSDWYQYGQTHDNSFGGVEEWNPIPRGDRMIDTLDQAFELFG